MSNCQQFVQQFSENDMVLKVRARDQRRARTTALHRYRFSAPTDPLERPSR